jgi:hypothetical protein
MARAEAAKRDVDYAVAVTLTKVPPASKVVVAAGDLTSHKWEATGATLRRYALALDLGSVPIVVDTTCAGLRGLVREGQELLPVNYVDPCGALRGEFGIVRGEYSYFDLDSLRLRRDVIQIQVGRRKRAEAVQD